MSDSSKKVLITGADGFIGSHLTELLVTEGYDIKALSQYNSYNTWGWLEDVNCLSKIEVLNGDISEIIDSLKSEDQKIQLAENS